MGFKHSESEDDKEKFLCFGVGASCLTVNNITENTVDNSCSLKRRSNICLFMCPC